MKLNLNCSFLIVKDLFEAISFGLEGLCEVLHFLVLEKGVSVPLILHLLQLALVDSFVLLDLKILSVNLLSEFVFPGDLGIQGLFLQIIKILPCPLQLISTPLLKLFVAFLKILMLKLELVVINLKLAFVTREVYDLFLQFSNLTLEIQNVFLQDFLLRLHKLCFLLIAPPLWQHFAAPK